MIHAMIPRNMYVKIFYILIACTLITAGVSFIDLGPLNTIAALAIGGLKASLVLMFFMRLRFSSRIIWVYALAGIFWLAILFTFSFSDYLSRTGQPPLPIDQRAFYERR